jgi:tRNA 2-thiouridine synthesizing protein D
MKTLTLFLTTTPYAYENTHTAIELARAALDQGWAVNLFASADGVHNFSRNQNPKGLPNAGKEFAELIARGLHVELCGTCLNFRGIAAKDFIPGAEPSTMKRLFGLMKTSDVFITLES